MRTGPGGPHRPSFLWESGGAGACATLPPAGQRVPSPTPPTFAPTPLPPTSSAAAIKEMSFVAGKGGVQSQGGFDASPGLRPAHELAQAVNGTCSGLKVAGAACGPSRATLCLVPAGRGPRKPESGQPLSFKNSQMTLQASRHQAPTQICCYPLQEAGGQRAKHSSFPPPRSSTQRLSRPLMPP